VSHPVLVLLAQNRASRSLRNLHAAALAVGPLLTAGLSSSERGHPLSVSVPLSPLLSVLPDSVFLVLLLALPVLLCLSAVLLALASFCCHSPAHSRRAQPQTKDWGTGTGRYGATTVSSACPSLSFSFPAWASALAPAGPLLGPSVSNCKRHSIAAKLQQAQPGAHTPCLPPRRLSMLQRPPTRIELRGEGADQLEHEYQQAKRTRQQQQQQQQTQTAAASLATAASGTGKQTPHARGVQTPLPPLHATPAAAASPAADQSSSFFSER
jgi:hypothetical protein